MFTISFAFNFFETTDLNTARRTLAGSGTDNTIGIAFGGGTPTNTGATETWNGSSWTEDGDLNTARNAMASSSGVGSTSALASGGNTGTITGATEEWTGAGSPLTKTFTTS